MPTPTASSSASFVWQLSDEDIRILSESSKERRLLSPVSTPRSSPDAARSPEPQPQCRANVLSPERLMEEAIGWLTQITLNIGCGAQSVDKRRTYRLSLKPQRPCLKYIPTRDLFVAYPSRRHNALEPRTRVRFRRELCTVLKD